LREETFIADQQTLAEVSDAIAAGALVAIDTEFIRERTYYPELCLIQIATTDLIACIDCLGSVDLTPLFAALLGPDCQWVLHSGRQDLEVVWNRAHALPKRLIDTQVAAALTGFSPQLGLQDLVTDLLGITLEKGHTRTDWSKRPLPAGALHYALDDVRYLLRAWARLQERLGALDRLAWFEEDCARLIDEPPVADATTIFRRIKAPGLSISQQCAALALVQWREQRAQQANRPRRWILADDHVARIARALPANAAALRAIADLPHGFVAHSGTEILAVIERSNSDDFRNRVAAMTADGKPDKTRVAALQAAAKGRAEQLGIHPEVLATRRDINALAAGADPGRVLAGWRAAELAALLD
jgi:ribonuclease D